jgi:pectin methylesterase-like acyl-CoA thioesterase
MVIRLILERRRRKKSNAATLGLGSGPAQAATLTVGSGGTYATIQAAIDAANSGDTIQVRNEIFNESLVITKSLTLLGGYEEDNEATTQPLQTHVISEMIDTATFTWSMGGDQVITVTVASPCDVVVSDTHTLSISSQRICLPLTLRNSS